MASENKNINSAVKPPRRRSATLARKSAIENFRNFCKTFCNKLFQNAEIKQIAKILLLQLNYNMISKIPDVLRFTRIASNFGVSMTGSNLRSLLK